MEHRTIRAGELLVMKDDNSKDIFLVESGRFQAYSYGSESRIPLGEIAAGELIGELSLLDGTNRSASVEAIEDSQVLCISAQDFKRAFNDQHPWVKALVSSLANRVKFLNRKIEALSKEPS